MVEVTLVVQIIAGIALLVLGIIALFRGRVALALGVVGIVALIGGGVFVLFALLLAAPAAEQMVILFWAHVGLAALGVLSVIWVLRRLTRRKPDI